MDDGAVGLVVAGIAVCILMTFYAFAALIVLIVVGVYGLMLLSAVIYRAFGGKDWHK
jgi:hypothetical protein